MLVVDGVMPLARRAMLPRFFGRVMLRHLNHICWSNIRWTQQSHSQSYLIQSPTATAIQLGSADSEEWNTSRSSDIGEIAAKIENHAVTIATAMASAISVHIWKQPKWHTRGNKTRNKLEISIKLLPHWLQRKRETWQRKLQRPYLMYTASAFLHTNKHGPYSRNQTSRDECQWKINWATGMNSAPFTTPFWHGIVCNRNGIKH